MNSSTHTTLGRVHSGVRTWLREFRAFMKRGSLIDLAVGVMIGGALGKIVSSFVADVVAPPLGLLVGEVHFSALKVRLGGTAAAPVTLNYGSFVQSLLDFVVVAAILFALIRLGQRLRSPAESTALTTDQQLLTEIRDHLRASGSLAAKTAREQLVS
jgi:large conductance mechanosensitive channel